MNFSFHPVHFGVLTTHQEARLERASRLDSRHPMPSSEVPAEISNLPEMTATEADSLMQLMLKNCSNPFMGAPSEQLLKRIQEYANRCRQQVQEGKYRVPETIMQALEKCFTNGSYTDETFSKYHKFRGFLKDEHAKAGS